MTQGCFIHGAHFLGTHVIVPTVFIQQQQTETRTAAMLAVKTHVAAVWTELTVYRMEYKDK